MKRVYIASAFRGDVDAHLRRAREACRRVALAGNATFASHLLLPQFLDDADPAQRGLGIAAGLAWLAVADEVLVVGPVTAGMRREIQGASEIGVPVRFEEPGR